MLVDLNAEIHQLKLNLASQLPQTEQLIIKPELDNKLRVRIWMVLGEGSVFIFLLILGFRAVRTSIARELNLAEQQKNFLLSVTHELKSPLAAIKLQLQTLKARNLDKEKQHLIYNRALNDTNRLEGLVENLLLVNKVESGNYPMPADVVDLSELINDIVSQSYPNEVSENKLSVLINKGGLVHGDSMALHSIVSNLIDNAFKYGNGSKVTISLVHTPSIMLTVSDGGPGISDNDKQKIFERFYRLGSESTRTTKGTGIGLYLVKSLVKLHHGQIAVEDKQPTGTSFIVTLPHIGD